MKIDADLPEVKEESKERLKKQAKEWEPVYVASNLGYRFGILIKLQSIPNVPQFILDRQKRMVAEALYRFERLRELMDEKELMEEDWDDGGEDEDTITVPRSTKEIMDEFLFGG